MTSHASTSNIDDLRRQAAEAQEAFGTACSSEAFLTSCQRLRDTGAQLSAASEAARKAEAEYLQAATATGVPAGKKSGKMAKDTTVLGAARRLSIGIPSFEDLRQVIFFDAKNTAPLPVCASPELVEANEQAASAEARARNKFFIELDKFTAQRQRVTAIAARYVSAREALARAEGAPGGSGDHNVADLADREFCSLKAVEGLEDYLHIR